MTKYTNSIKTSLFIAGLTEMIFGLAHFIMPVLIFSSKGFQQLSLIEIDSITLSIFSVGILLIAIGFISVFCALKYEKFIEITLIITIIKIILWLIRIVFEFIFPFKISVLNIHNPSIYTIPMFIVLWSIFVLSVILILMDKRKRNLNLYNE